MISIQQTKDKCKLTFLVTQKQMIPISLVNN